MTTSKDINFQCWEGYESAQFLSAFQRKSDASIRPQTLLSDASAAEQIASGNLQQCHVLNINNAWIRDYLHPRGLIRRLDPNQFESSMDGLLKAFDDGLGQWCRNDDGEQIGICQRFGPFNLVVNKRKIDQRNAEDQGFQLADDPCYHGRYGILSYIDFNLFHLCIAAELNPFETLNVQELSKVELFAGEWVKHASVISDDHFVLNQALIDGDIDFYLSGGVYTAAVARRDGHNQIHAITPTRGPVDGKGGIVFAEITSIIETSQTPASAELFLQWLTEPDTAVAAAMTERTCNPVAQMGNPAVFRRFNTAQLDWIQWDELEECVARSSHYSLMPNQAEVLALWQRALAMHKPEHRRES